jgi:hypothetical protein
MSRATEVGAATHQEKGLRAMNRTRGLLSKALIAAVGCIGAAGVLAPIAQAQFEILDPGGSVQINGEFSRQAGAHPDFTNTLGFPGGESVKEIKVELPPGFLADPTAFPTCTNTQLFEINEGKSPNCPIGSQIGTARVRQLGEGGAENGELVSVYNMAHGDDVPGLFAINYAGVLISFVPEVVPRGDEGEYGIRVTVPTLSQALAVVGSTVTFWGDPADPSHDPLRFNPAILNYGVASNAPNLPFMRSPTSCSETPGATFLEADSWQQPQPFAQASFDAEADGTPYVFERCDIVPFEPTAEVHSGTHRAASPTGLDVDITVPQSSTPYGIATADAKKIVTTLPLGMTVSPSAVAGLGACSLAQIDLGSNSAPTCPDSSKIGTVSIKTPVLEEPLEGEVILARQNENPFHSLFAIYLVAKGPGFYLKLPAELSVDKQTGQVRTIFYHTPQLPFEEAHLELRGGPTAPLVTPGTCGTYDAKTEITSWASEAPVTETEPMTIDEGCSEKGAFNPSLQAGVSNPVAGAHSPLTLRVRREDGEQNISRLEFTLPKGELAKLKGVETCPEALTASGACGPRSQVGVLTTAIGTGAFPLFVPQPGKDPTALYLAGPYKGAPFSLIAKVPAQTGPFDFGNIVVRTAVNVDPLTTQVTAVSDPLPQFLEGVPISYRDVRVEVTRPDFTLNPTSCEPTKVTSTITGVTGATATPASPFQVADCEALGFAPKLVFSLKGGTARSKNPALKAVLTAPAGQANISSVQVILPKSEFIDNRHISNPCTRVQFDAGAGNGAECPAKSILGRATAYSPLLENPLTGNVYFRSNGGERKLPDLVASLNGQIHVNLVGFIDSIRQKGTESSRVRNTFASVPDAPVSRFVLELQGGKKGLLQNSTNLCKTTNRATVKMDGQNGKAHDFEPVVSSSCGGAGRSKGK